jgi:hypothetical protein
MRTAGPQLWLVAAGIGLGYLARITLGGPPAEPEPLNSFPDPIVEPEEETIDLPIIGKESVRDGSGLVPPIRVPGRTTTVSTARLTRGGLTDFTHDDSAMFEPHGEQICASGCAVSRHPTGALTKRRFEQLLKDYSRSPLDETNSALEELLFYGPQTGRMIEQFGCAGLGKEQASFLREQLEYTHAKISIRVVDQHGIIRTWLDQSLVPFDRRHVFEMETRDLQPLVTSGTVKRVGLNHLWTRL